MKYIIQNVIRGPITTVIGLLIICITTYACTFQDMNWIWEGFAGCFAGSVFVFLSDEEVKKYLKLTIDFLLKKLVG